MIDGIITDVLKAEGWDKYTNHPADRGGPTKWGITERAWLEYRAGTDYIDPDVRNITEVQARHFYYTRYIGNPGFLDLPHKLMPLVVDCAVNHGPYRATKWLQRAVGVSQDGRLGPKTRAATAEVPWVRTYARICAYRVRLYGRLAGRDHTQAVFIEGWNNRAARWIEELATLWLDG